MIQFQDFQKPTENRPFKRKKIDGLVWGFLGFCSRFVGLRWCNRQGILINWETCFNQTFYTRWCPHLNVCCFRSYTIELLIYLAYTLVILYILYYPILIPLSQVGGTMFVTCCSFIVPDNPMTHWWWLFYGIPMTHVSMVIDGAPVSLGLAMGVHPTCYAGCIPRKKVG